MGICNMVCLVAEKMCGKKKSKSKWVSPPFPPNTAIGFSSCELLA